MAITLNPVTSVYGHGTRAARPFKFDIILSGDRNIGHIEGFEIGRSAAQRTGDFHLALEDLSEGLYNFAKTLFEQTSGKFRSKFYNGRPYQRGIGCFGRELDGVNFIFVEELAIEAETDRQKGFGTAALAKFHELYRCKYPFVFVWPAVLSVYQSSNAIRDQVDLSVGFYRKNSYRRIGNTEYFAYAQDPTHPSRQVLAQNDAPGEPRGRPPTEMSIAFPLHCKVLQSEPRLFDIIRDVDVSQIHLRDDFLQTSLHYAADSGKFMVALSLLERSTEELFLENAYGQTPLAAVEDRVAEVKESLQEVMPDFQTLIGQGREERLLQISTKPLARVLREFQDYILDARAKGLSADQIQNHINARIAPEKEDFLQRLQSTHSGH
ncbi:hypothetical protein FPV67DRAFT_1667067 [Lyophyllum atratum]|nr:hypothetical protein FPV67DRAFT_1667067 [Lyophyllum atratum]